MTQLLNVYHSDFVPDSDVLPLSKGFFIDDPSATGYRGSDAAELINATLHVLAPFIAQHNVNAFVAYKTGISLTSDRANNGAVYLLGPRSRRFNLTENLKANLPDDISQNILDFPVIHQRTSLFERINNAPEDGSFIFKSMLIDRFTNVKDKSMKVLSPAVLLHQMYDEKVAPGATTQKLTDLAPLFAQLGFSFDSTPDKAPIFMERLFKHSEVLEPVDYDKVKGIVSAIYTKCYEPFSKPINEHLKSVMGSVGQALIRADAPYYEIHYKGMHIGALGKMQNRDWLLTQHIKDVPMDLNAISRIFPSNLRSLLPERRVRNGLPCSINEADLPDILNDKPFLMNNLSVRQVNQRVQLPPVKEDVLTVRLGEFDDMILPGDTLKLLKAYKQDPTRQADKILGDTKTPSIAGAQAKVPISIKSTQDNLSLAINGDFSHILKVHNNDDPKKRAMIYCEAFGMLAAKAIGLPVADIKMLGSDIRDASEIIPGQPKTLVSQQHPSIVIERFDVRHSSEPEAVSYYNEEFISLARIPDKAYSGQGNQIHGIDIVSDTVKSHTTDWERDKTILFKTALLNTLIGNIDAHLKNWSMLHVRDANGQINCTLSPAYDIVAVRCCDAYYFDSSGICQINQGNDTSLQDIIDFGTKHCDMSDNNVIETYSSVVKALTKFSRDCSEDDQLKSVFSLTALGEDTLRRCQRFVDHTVRTIEHGNNLSVEDAFQYVFSTKRTMEECNRESNEIIENLEYRAAQDALEQMNEYDDKLRELFSDDSIMDLDGLFSVSSSPSL